MDDLILVFLHWSWVIHPLYHLYLHLLLLSEEQISVS